MRVRFAPSPTGNLHIGTLRTALFNWILAQHCKGNYVLRIEDTDLNRSESIYESTINEGLAWMGLIEDEGPQIGGNYGPYRQSERIVKGIYAKAAQTLLQSGHAYPCFCTSEDLDKEREEAQKAGIAYVYSRKCLGLSKDEINAKKQAGDSFTIRFKMPDSDEIVFQDLIRGKIRFELNLLSDFVILKSDGSPSYNFACVVDDADMKISHVIRGEDHISNTPRQIALFQALGFEVPRFAHMPMILGPDKSKLSKRHGATNVTEYRDQGYLPEALFNFLSLLGWTPPDEQEILSQEEICRVFEIEKVNKSGAVFDVKKLKWMNGQYIRKLNEVALHQKVMPFIAPEFLGRLNQVEESIQKKMIFSVRDNLELLSDINHYIEVYLLSTEQYQQRISEFSFSDQDKEVLEIFLGFLKSSACNWEWDDVDILIEKVLEQTGLGKGKVMKPIRLATSAWRSGPNLSDFLWISGKSTLISRLESVLNGEFDT